MDLLFNISLPFATIGLLAFIYYTFTRERMVFTTATVSSVISFLLLSIILAGMIIEYGLDISFVQSSRYLIFAWFIMAIYFVTEFRYRIRLLGSILMPIALMLMLVSLFADNHASGIVVSFGGGAILIHITLVLIGLTMLFLSFAAASLFLVKRNALKNHRFAALDDRLPPLTQLKGLMEMSFYGGFPVLTVGLILGIVYAGSLLHGGWVWDSKIIWGLINWFIYSILFLLRQSGRVNNQVLARGIVVLFLFIITSFILTSHRLPVSSTDNDSTTESILDDKP